MAGTGPQARTLGIILIVLGVLAILVPVVMASAVATWVGILLVVAGGAELLYGKRAEGQSRMGAILTVLIGAMLIVAPMAGLAIVSILLAIYFLGTGINLASLGWRIRPRKDWVAIFATGLICILFGIVFLADWPVSGAKAMGIFIGIRLILGGYAVMSRADAAA